MTSYTEEQIKKIIEENNKLKEIIKDKEEELDIRVEEVGVLQCQIINLKEDMEKQRLEKIKFRNDLEIANMLYIDETIRKEIDDSISKGWDQIHIYCGRGFYKDHKLNYIKEYVLKELTTYSNGDSEYSSYRNGYYYYDGDCMCPYEVEYNNDGTFSFSRVESESEEEYESDSDYN